MSPALPNDGNLVADEVEAVAEVYRARLHAGERPDRQAYLRAHPRLARALEQRLLIIDMLYREVLAGPDSSAPTHLQGKPGTGPPEIRSAETTPLDPTVVNPEAPRKWLSSLPDYAIIAELGRGGMGVVYLARQISLNRMVALKMILAGAHAPPQYLARFRMEAEMLASLRHPNIVQVYDVGEHEKCPYIALEYLDGGTLDRKLENAAQPPIRAARLIETLARAMHAAHQRGIVHRDLKPANVMLLKADGDPEWGHWGIPKITDFGLARRLQEGLGHTTSGVIMGTPCYMAPEQAQGKAKHAGPLADVYSLGAILFEMMTGNPPFLGDSEVATLQQVVDKEPVIPGHLRPRLPRDLEIICLRCLEKDPAKRYATAEALADDLRRFQVGEPIQARAVSMAERTVKWIRRRPAQAALVGVILLAVASLIGLGAWSNIQLRAAAERERQRAELAREVVDDMYVRVAEEWLEDEPAMDSVQREFLEKALHLYEAFAKEEGGDPAVRRKAALAFFRVGQIRSKFHEYTAAEEAFHEAIRRQEELAHADPANAGTPNADYCADLAASHTWLGEMLREMGKPLDEVERHFRKALDLYQAMSRERPRNAAYRTELARAHYNLGIVEMDTDRAKAALADYDASIKLLESLNDEEPKNREFRSELARSLINRGVLFRSEGSFHRNRGQYVSAENDYRRAAGLLLQLTSEVPRRVAYRFDLAIALQDLGNVLSVMSAAHTANPSMADLAMAAGRDLSARAALRQSRDLLNGMVKDFASRPGYRKKLANTHNSLGFALAQDSEGREAAGAEWNKAREHFLQLIADYPNAPDHYKHLAIAEKNLAWLAEERDWNEARLGYEKSLRQVRKARNVNPKNREYRILERDCLRGLAEACIQSREAVRAAEAATAMADLFPDDAQYAYFAACFTARSFALLSHDDIARNRLADQAAALLAKVGVPIERIPNETEAFTGLIHFRPEIRARLNQIGDPP